MSTNHETGRAIAITKENFLIYEETRKSGITNMFDLNNVCSITRLNRAQAIDIMKNYHLYITKWGSKQ